MIPGPTGQVKVGKGEEESRWMPGRSKGRAFSRRCSRAGQTASGFFYFQTGLQTGATIYLNGLTEAGTGKELFYFEIPLQ